MNAKLLFIKELGSVLDLVGGAVACGLSLQGPCISTQRELLWTGGLGLGKAGVGGLGLGLG